MKPPCHTMVTVNCAHRDKKPFFHLPALTDHFAFPSSGMRPKTRGPSRLATSPMYLTPLMGSSTWTRGQASTETPKSLITEWKLLTCHPSTWVPSFTQLPISLRRLWARPQVRSSHCAQGISHHFYTLTWGRLFFLSTCKARYRNSCQSIPITAAPSCISH